MDLRELIATGRLDRRTLLKIAAATGGRPPRHGSPVPAG